MLVRLDKLYILNESHILNFIFEELFKCRVVYIAILNEHAKCIFALLATSIRYSLQ